MNEWRLLYHSLKLMQMKMKSFARSSCLCVLFVKRKVSTHSVIQESFAARPKQTKFCSPAELYDEIAEDETTTCPYPVI